MSVQPSVPERSITYNLFNIQTCFGNNFKPVTKPDLQNYVHGYSERETERLYDQAGSVRHLIHHELHLSTRIEGA